MAELLGCLLKHHLHFVNFSGFDAVESDQAIPNTNPHGTASDFP